VDSLAVVLLQVGGIACKELPDLMVTHGSSRALGKKLLKGVCKWGKNYFVKLHG